MNVSPKKKRSNARVVCGEFFADIVSDARSKPPIHHWIVQREGSPEVIALGQEGTIEEAEGAARACITDLAQREARNRA